MILLDTNVILRYLVPTATSEPDDHVRTARALFASVERGEELITTTEVVLHEVAYVLASSKQYDRPVEEIVTVMSDFLELPGMRLPRGDKRRYRAALDLWRRHPAIGFADALVVTTAATLGAQLATFDKKMMRLPGINLWSTPAEP